MKIKTISFKRTKNLGNYESEHCEMMAEIEADENVDECFTLLKNQVEKALGLIKPEPKNYDENPF